ncbi:MAG: Meckel syndrome type 1 protein, partial [Pseudonocardiales bacterium]|nr:Meckel syndrome type 1 protein [Pseudonocardiales bacterium]
MTAAAPHPPTAPPTAALSLQRATGASTLGQLATARWRRPGPPLGQPRPAWLGSVAAGAVQFAAGTNRPTPVRRSIAGPGGHGSQVRPAANGLADLVRPPRWWAEPDHSARPVSTPGLDPQPVRRTAASLPLRGLRRASSSVPTEQTWSPSASIRRMAPTEVKVGRHPEVVAAGGLLMQQDRARLTAPRRPDPASAGSPPGQSTGDGVAQPVPLGAPVPVSPDAQPTSTTSTPAVNGSIRRSVAAASGAPSAARSPAPMWARGLRYRVQRHALPSRADPAVAPARPSASPPDRRAAAPPAALVLTAPVPTAPVPTAPVTTAPVPTAPPTAAPTPRTAPVAPMASGPTAEATSSGVPAVRPDSVSIVRRTPTSAPAQVVAPPGDSTSVASEPATVAPSTAPPWTAPAESAAAERSALATPLRRSMGALAGAPPFNPAFANAGGGDSASVTDVIGARSTPRALASDDSSVRPLRRALTTASALRPETSSRATGAGSSGIRPPTNASGPRPAVAATASPELIVRRAASAGTAPAATAPGAAAFTATAAPVTASGRHRAVDAAPDSAPSAGAA